MSQPVITKFTNGFILRNGSLTAGDLWISSETGKIIASQTAFYSSHLQPDQTVDLKGKILSPGLIDVQLNGGHGFDFSIPELDFQSKLTETNKRFVKSGVTSYLPTIISQQGEVYKEVLPYLGPSGTDRDASKGAESLGAHVEGPFLSPCRNGIHNKSVLQAAETWSDIEACYGKSNLENIRKVTAAPERGNIISLIPEFTSRGIVFSLGHSDADFETASSAIAAGATMVTHMFNAMRPFGHRDPGIFGLLGQSASNPATPNTSRPPSRANSTSASPHRSPRSSRTTPRSSLSISTTTSDVDTELRRPRMPKPGDSQPFFGLIADGIHLSPQSLKIAYSAFPEGAILVTDALKFAGLPDGTYEWTNGDVVVKEGASIRHAQNGRLAGVAVSLIECINNFRRFTGCGTAKALECVTSHPAAMLGSDVKKSKGRLEVDMDADLVILSGGASDEEDLKVDGVWKFGVQVA
jgi:N-acetylglucosamine-6-phosphate deacetylase